MTFLPLRNGLILAAVLSGIAHGRDDLKPGRYFPPSAGSWETVAPPEAKARPLALRDAIGYAGEKNSKAVVVLWRGRILAERYWDGWNERTRGNAYSASKSLVSSLVGMAIEEGKIESVTQKSAAFLDEWKKSPDHRKISIENHLAMNAGLEGGRRVFLKGVFTPNERQFATALPAVHSPGTHWEYHNSAYRLLFSILEESTGQSLPRYTKDKLFDPLAMRESRWLEKRRGKSGFRGRFAERRENGQADFTFLEMSARDAARYGLFILREGNWAGRQLLSRDWVRQATRPARAEVNPSYGYLWWLNGGDFHYKPLDDTRHPGPIFPGCPDDAFAALGKDDQKIYIVPSLQLVVVRLGEAANARSPAISTFDSEFLGRVCRSFAGEG